MYLNIVVLFVAFCWLGILATNSEPSSSNIQQNENVESLSERNVHDGLADLADISNVPEPSSVESDTADSADISRTSTETIKGSLKIDPLHMYQNLFTVKRAEQVRAVKRIQQIDNYAKQYNMVKLVLDKIFSVLQTARMKLAETGYLPGDEFPTDEAQKHAVGELVENTAFMSELLLRLPDTTHQLYDGDNEQRLLLSWCLRFCHDSRIFQGPHLELLDLAAQEAGVTEKSPDYVNPYKEETRRKMEREKEMEALEAEREKKLAKKKKKKQRGPRLAGGSGGEL